MLFEIPTVMFTFYKVDGRHSKNLITFMWFVVIGLGFVQTITNSTNQTAGTVNGTMTMARPIYNRPTHNGTITVGDVNVPWNGSRTCFNCHLRYTTLVQNYYSKIDIVEGGKDFCGNFSATFSCFEDLDNCTIDKYKYLKSRIEDVCNGIPITKCQKCDFMMNTRYDNVKTSLTTTINTYEFCKMFLGPFICLRVWGCGRVSSQATFDTVKKMCDGYLKFGCGMCSVALLKMLKNFHNSPFRNCAYFDSVMKCITGHKCDFILEKEIQQILENRLQNYTAYCKDRSVTYGLATSDAVRMRNKSTMLAFLLAVVGLVPWCCV